VTSWADLERGDPELAALGRSRFDAAHVALIGTVRPDGSPRISPVEPYLLEGQLVIGVMRSAKADDLAREARCTIHSVVTKPDGGEPEFKVAGRVVVTSDPRIVSAEAGWWAGRPREVATVYAIDIDEAVSVTSDIERGRIRIVRWRPSAGSTVTERDYP